LSVVLAGWPEDNPNWEGYFPEFSRAVGELRKEIHDHDNWDPRTIFDAERWKNGHNVHENGGVNNGASL
jgi:hypothetical protein